MKTTTDRRRDIEETVCDVVREHVSQIAADVAGALIQEAKDRYEDPEGDQRERLYRALLGLLERQQQLTATESYRPSMYAVAHEFHLKPEDVLFLQGAVAEQRRAA